MVDRRDDIRYLNRFLRDAWSGLSGILECEITHRAFKESARQPGRMSRRWTRVDLSRGPRISEDGSERLVLRMPGTGSSRFSTRIYLLPAPLIFPRIIADVDFALSLSISANADPKMEVEVDVGANALGELLDRVAGWKAMIESSFSGDELEDEIGYFGAARYAPDNVPSIPEPELVFPDRPRLQNGIRIVLVPESFDSADLSRFDDAVGAIVRLFSEPDTGHANEPYYSFRSAVSIWTIKPDQTPGGDHVMGSFVDPRGHRRVAVGNLARLAAIGRKAEGAGSGPQMIVYIVNPDAPRFGGRRPSAMALGNVVMQPLQSTPTEDAYLLLHELSHTGLARLGDEYILRNRREERYLGRQPVQVNLDSDPEQGKWRRWKRSPQPIPTWDTHGITGVEGAGYFGQGIWRPAEVCAMQSSKEGVQFCAVCREALTKGIRTMLGPERLLLRIDHPDGHRDHVELGPRGTSVGARTLKLRNTGAADLVVTPVASTLPEPWRITGRLERGGEVSERPGSGLTQAERASRRQLAFSATPGDRLSIQARSRCPFTPWDPLPVLEVDLEFVE